MKGDKTTVFQILFIGLNKGVKYFQTYKGWRLSSALLWWPRRWWPTLQCCFPCPPSAGWPRWRSGHSLPSVLLWHLVLMALVAGVTGEPHSPLGNLQHSWLLVGGEVGEKLENFIARWSAEVCLCLGPECLAKRLHMFVTGLAWKILGKVFNKPSSGQIWHHMYICWKKKL